jgi:hypothetical protein
MLFLLFCVVAVALAKEVSGVGVVLATLRC